MTVIRSIITDRNVWLHQWRPGYLGASDVAAAAGKDRFKTRLALYAEKAGLVMPQSETPAMRRGRLLEGAAVEYLRDERPTWRIIRPNLFLSDPEIRLSATPDALAEDPDEPGLINAQIKVVSAPVFEGWEGEAPIGYQLQVTTENMLLDAARGVLVVLVMGSYSADLHMFDVPRHAGAEQKIRDLAVQFWDDVAAGRMPRPDYKRDQETIAEIYPPNGIEPPVMRDLSLDNAIGTILELRERAKAAEKAAKETITELDAAIVEKLAGSQLAMAPGWKITRKMQHRDEYLVKAQDYPVLRVTKLKEDA